MIKDYTILIWYSEDDGGYIAQIPELHGCIVFGETPEKAAREIQIAGQMLIDTIKENGDPLPEPRERQIA